MPRINFPTNSAFIYNRLLGIDPVKYKNTRNFINGSVTYLSPYITHGFLTLCQIRDSLLEKYNKNDCQKILQELAWREYFQRVHEAVGNGVWTDIRNAQSYVQVETGIPKVFICKNTDIKSIDVAIRDLETSGYMHNHARMWTAMLATNIYGFYWQDASRWMYYHLLDGDIASNTLSWQWVAGTFSSKVYVANQENINTYDRINEESGTYLDTAYENLEHVQLNEKYHEYVAVDKILEVVHPDRCIEKTELATLLNTNKNIFLYHMWNLNPEYSENFIKIDPTENRLNIFIIERTHLENNPISKKRIDFVQDLALQNIPHIKIVYMDFRQFTELLDENHKIVTTKHQNIAHFEDQCLKSKMKIVELPYLFPGKKWKSGGFMSWYNST